jgi:sigma-B regulation protein RsbQ
MPYHSGMEVGDTLNATLSGPSGTPVLAFVHGFGCGREMWRPVAPAFSDDFRVLLLDLPGSAAADPSTYDPVRHASLDGYAEDVLKVLAELGLDDVTFVGHSVASMIGVLAHRAAPTVVTRLVMVSPSACYVDDGEYVGGFSASDIDDLLTTMERNQLGWQAAVAGMVAGAGHEEARTELEDAFCRTRPDVALQFAEVTFHGDNRADLPHVSAPTLVLQVRDDVIAPMTAGEFIHRQITGSVMRVLETRGHAPHLTNPDEVVSAIRDFLPVGVT